MKKSSLKFSKILTVVSICFLFILPVFSLVSAAGDSPATICNLTSVIMSGFNMVIAVLPLTGLAVLMFGTFLWATATSDPQKLQRAQQTLTYGVIGLIAGLSAVVIIGTLEMFLIGDSKFKWIDEDGRFLKVNFCLEEYEAQ